MGWFGGRARRRRQAELDAVDDAFGLDTPQARAQYERGRERARIAAQGELRRRQIEGLDALGVPKPASDSETAGLPGEQYKEFVTGAPEGVYYLVRHPATNRSYNFDGYLNGHLIWTIADYAHQFDGVGPLVGGLEGAYIDSARLQDAVRQGYPVMWCVQQAADVDRLRSLLADAGVAGIVVQHMPSS